MIRISKISLLILLSAVLGLQVACNGSSTAGDVSGTDLAGDARTSKDKIGADVPGTDLAGDVPVVADVLKDGHKEAGCGRCTGGKTCRDGKCKCPGSQADCSGQCTTLGTDMDCSACGDKCTNGRPARTENASALVHRLPVQGSARPWARTRIARPVAINAARPRRAYRANARPRGLTPQPGTNGR